MNSLSSTYSYRTFLVCAFLVILGGLLLGYSIFFGEKKEDFASETIWIIDTSLSMGVEDISGGFSNTLKSRLDLAKSIILSGSSLLPGDHGIIGYARNAGVLLPLSHENIYRENIVSNIQPTTLYGGSSVQDAFMLINSLYSTKNNPFHIILLTDGGDTNMGELPLLPGYAKLSIISIGTPEGGKIPLGYDNEGKRRYKRFQNSEIISKLEINNIDLIRKQYNAPTFSISHWGDQDELIHIILSGNYSIQENQGNTIIKKVSSSIILFLGSLFIILGYLLSPYKKPKKIPKTLISREIKV